MNIYTKIKKDHDEARDMMERILETQDGPTRLELFGQLKVAILSHAKAEERTFYNALKAANDDLAEETPHMKHEHKEVEELFHEIDQIETGNHMWWEKFGEARQALLHHMEEEEKEIFKEAKKEISGEDASELGERMEAIEEKLKPEIEEKEQAAA